MKKYLFLIFCLSFQFFSNKIFATHILGYDLNYKYIGNEQYTIYLSLYRDCFYGAPAALLSDEQLSYAIFDKITNQKIQSDNVTFASKNKIADNIINPCLPSLPNNCIEAINFNFNITLPTTSKYYLTIERCCFGNIQSININGNSSSQGIVMTTDIIAHQSSAFIKTQVPLRVCANKPIQIDCSAIDPDGDSLSYDICTLNQIDLINNSNPSPADIIAAPYQYLAYNIGYNYNNPLGSSATFSLNNKTGLLDVSTFLQGYYIVGVCCKEWKNGNFIHSTTRAFSICVFDCSAISNNKIVCDSNTVLYSHNNFCYSNCNGNKTINLSCSNNSLLNYYWNFGDKTTLNDTSNLASISYTYPDTGIYIVTLAINNNGCVDTMQKAISIYIENLQCDFILPTILEPCQPITLLDNSTSTNTPITYWYWKDTAIFSFVKDANNYQILNGENTIQHIISTANGCWAEKTKTYKTAADLIIPNAFTPNGDSKNDNFFILNNCGLTLKKFLIFNRVGNLVYTFKSEYDAWDGTQNGKPVDANTYFWVAWFLDSKGNSVIKKGDVILIR